MRTSGRIGVALAGVMFVAALVGPLFTQNPNLTDYVNELAPPSASNWLGTDLAGRDLLARTVVGIRTSLQSVLVVFVVSTALGLIVGCIAGFARGTVDAILSRVIDVLLGLPSLILALAIVGVLGVGNRNLVIALVAAGWAQPARLARGLVLASHTRLDVVAARLAGISSARNMLTHVLPSTFSTVTTAATAGIGDTVLALAGLSFLGLGAQPPTAELGQMLADSQNTLGVAPWQLIGPSLAVIWIATSAMLMSDSLGPPQPAPLYRGSRHRSQPRRTAQLAGPVTVPKSPVLVVNDLSVTYSGGVRAVRNVSVTLDEGTCLALVGESGCGKTSIARAVLGIAGGAAKVEGAITVGGHNVIDQPERGMRVLRGTMIGYVPQDPFGACDPLRRVGHHVEEPWRIHRRRRPADEPVACVTALGVPDAARCLTQRPHQWSGGMLQRATVAASAVHDPWLTVADEPTSALDAELADDVLDCLRSSSRALLLVSHDLTLVARHADRVAVIYSGRIVEEGDTAELIAAPRHPYTQALLGASPRNGDAGAALLAGTPPLMTDMSSPGCPFAPRCDCSVARCHDEEPLLVNGVACWVSPLRPSDPVAR